MADVLLLKLDAEYKLPDNCYVKIEDGNKLCVYQAVVEPWNGEGLPPVGAVCEYNNLEPHPVSTELKWSTIHIVAHDTQGGDVFAVFSSLSGYHGNRRPECFRPILTPERVAKDLLEKEAVELFLTINPRGKWHKLDDGMKASYRAAITLGYRKFEITDDSDPA